MAFYSLKHYFLKTHSAPGTGTQRWTKHTWSAPSDSLPSHGQKDKLSTDAVDRSYLLTCKLSVLLTSYRSLEIPCQQEQEVAGAGAGESPKYAHEKGIRSAFGPLPGSELLLTVGLKQQTWFLFRLLLFHWCFSIYLSDQVIKYLNKNKRKSLTQQTFEILLHKTVLVLVNVILLSDLCFAALFSMAGFLEAPGDSRGKAGLPNLPQEKYACSKILNLRKTLVVRNTVVKLNSSWNLLCFKTEL